MPASPEPGYPVSASPTLRDEPIDLPLQEKSKEQPNPEAEPDDQSTGVTQPPPRHNSGETTADGHDTDVLIVDWEGPDDPENPKKCVVLPASAYDLNTVADLRFFLVGASNENGLRQPLFPLSRS